MKKIGDLIGGIFCILIGSAVTIGSIGLQIGTPMKPGPGFFPFVLGISLTILSLLLLIAAWHGRSTGMDSFGDLKGPAYLTMGLFVYSVVLDFLGYVISTVMLAAVVLLIMELRSWWKIVAISIAISIVTYVLFDRFLGIMLPKGILQIFSG